MSNHIVIGANFGDEGKGLITDYLSSKLNDNIVIRFNGGAQAAHTVEHYDRRHVFHHIGSGTLRGSATFLSHYFIVNPRVFNQEIISVPEDNVRVYAHRSAMLTTPYDWLLNQRVESHRGKQQHGTTGMGINETVSRIFSSHEDKTPGDATRGEQMQTTLADIYNIKLLRAKLNNIKEIWVPKRAKLLGINPEYIQSYNVDDYISDCELMSKFIIPVSNYNVLKYYKNRVFEGAQGLLLDEFHYFYPHVTRSRTGINNATEILRTIGEKEAETHYVTRSYLTRHGNGPLPLEGEIDEKEDYTNRPNKHQHELRFAPLDLELLKESINNDLKDHNGIELSRNLNLTWANYKDRIKINNEFQYNDELFNELKQKLPGFKQTWFYDRYATSGVEK